MGCNSALALSRMETKNIPVSDLEANAGQIEGLPRNPRKIGEANLAALRECLSNCHIMTALRELIVTPGRNGKYVVIAGNQRLAALQEDTGSAVPCIVVTGASPSELQAIALLDNVHYGQWDGDRLTADWSEEELEAAMVNMTEAVERLAADDFGQEFSLPDGEQRDEHTVTFYLSAEQASEILPIIETAESLYGTKPAGIIRMMMDLNILPHDRD